MDNTILLICAGLFFVFFFYAIYKNQKRAEKRLIQNYKNFEQSGQNTEIDQEVLHQFIINY